MTSTCSHILFYLYLFERNREKKTNAKQTLIIKMITIIFFFKYFYLWFSYFYKNKLFVNCNNLLESLALIGLVLITFLFWASDDWARSLMDKELFEWELFVSENHQT